MDFKQDFNQGQLNPEERQLVYETVLELKPKVCVECGTWKGGGSTFFIASALHELNYGVLLTWEIELEFHNAALEFYRTKDDLESHIVFINADFNEGIKEFFTNIDFALLDGPDTSEYNVKSLKLLEEKMSVGGIVILHDWNNEKCRGVREYLQTETPWETVITLDKTETGMIKIKLVK